MSGKQEAENTTGRTYMMRCVKTSGFGNTMVVGSISIRMAATVVIGLLGGIALWNTELFHANWIALLAYAAFINLLLGHTPTGRNLLTNIYGIVFKRPANMTVTEDLTIDAIGHGITEADTLSQGSGVIPFRMAGTKNFILVYAVTSSIGYWSSDEDKIGQARLVKSLYNILEDGEALYIVEKQDNDTGMLALKSHLEEEAKKHQPEGEDFEALAARRIGLLSAAGTKAAARSIQQYAILSVKPKNVNRTVTALKKCCKTIRPAAYPLDVLFACMGFEGGETLGRGGEEA